MVTRRTIKKFGAIKRHGLTIEQSSNSFTDEDLEGMAHGNNPVANAYRELLAFRKTESNPDRENRLEDALSVLLADVVNLREDYPTEAWRFSDEDIAEAEAAINMPKQFKEG